MFKSRIICGICFVLMIMAAGSDGPCFPVANYIGTFVFGFGFVISGLVTLKKENKITI